MKNTAILAAALTLGLAGAAMAQDALTERQVRTQLEQQGYTKVHDLKFDDGMWRAHARSGDGTRVSVRVDPRTGQAFPDEQVSRLSETDVRAALSTEGYTDVHDVGFKHGVWHAKADDRAGKRVKLQIDPETGKIIGTD
ncbi:peptidase M4 [Frateuria sp. Soil773]|uniref:PepSY domain-containing protein n=1 Tax=Frateuria sp. Soil773 TaxID=1736407 RepID=UPI0006FBE974|nr:PepSY domain-containing protein [Frateuria sp. Soil773]KRE89222.1 peptidase M4 [Frateuria sp. Soil773]